MPPRRPFDDIPDGELAAQAAWLRRVAARLVRDHDVAEDVAQDTWLLLARRGEGAVGAGRLAAFAQNLGRHWRRAERRRRGREERAARPEALPGPDVLAEALECQRVLVEELQALPADARELLVLRTYAELSTTQIARERGVPESTVRDRLRRAEALLRERLDRRFGGRREVWSTPLAWLPRPTASTPTPSTPPGVAAWHTIAKTLLTMKATTKIALVSLPLVVLVLRSSGEIEPPAESLVAATPAEPRSVMQPPSPLPHRPDDRMRAAIDDGRALPGTTVTPPLELLVRDAATHVVAPFYAVELLDAAGDRVALVETDTTGAVSIGAELAAGAARLRAVDHIDLELESPAERELVRPEDDTPLVFEVDLGPSYDLVLPPERPSTSVGAFLQTQAYFPDSLGQRRFERGAPLRAGAPPWVRFDPADGRRIAQAGLAAFVSLRDQEGLWQASGATATTAGHAPAPVFLEGGGCGFVSAVVTVEGAPPPSRVDIHLIRRTDDFDGNRDLRAFEVGADFDGRFEAAYLTPGTWTMDMRAAGVGPMRRELEVFAAEARALTFDLTRAVGQSAITVVIESESGRAPLGLVGVVARPVDGAGAPVRVSPSNPRHSGTKRLFLEGLTLGRWTIMLTGVEGLGRFAPGRSMEVDAVAGEVRFTCLDRGVDWTPRTLTVVRADTGAPVSDATFAVWADGAALLTRGLSRGEGELPPLAPDTSVDLAVHARGCRAILLRDVALPQEGPLVVRLEPGWGTVLVAHGIDEESAPLAGVRVSVDGVPRGVTDARGRLLVTAEQRPATVSCELPGWRMFAGAIDPATGAFTTASDIRPSDVLFRPE